MERTPVKFGQVAVVGNNAEHPVEKEAFTASGENKIYTVTNATHKPFKDGSVTVYVNDAPVSTGFTIDYTEGTVTFTPDAPEATPAFSYTWLETVPTQIYAVPTNSRAQIIQIFAVNPTSSAIDLKLYAHGSTSSVAESNLILQSTGIDANGGLILDNLKIILSAEENLAARGTGLYITAYGILETELV